MAQAHRRFGQRRGCADGQLLPGDDHQMGAPGKDVLVPEYLLRIRRFDPKSGEAAYWDEHSVDLGERNSVLDAILKIRDEVDGSVGIRCSCQQAICGSCGGRVNGKPGLGCKTHLEEAAGRAGLSHGTGWNPAEGEGIANGGSGAGDTTPEGVI